MSRENALKGQNKTVAGSPLPVKGKKPVTADWQLATFYIPHSEFPIPHFPGGIIPSIPDSQFALRNCLVLWFSNPRSTIRNR
jgi:hypothetical protein